MCQVPLCEKSIVFDGRKHCFGDRKASFFEVIRITRTNGHLFLYVYWRVGCIFVSRKSGMKG